MDSGWDLCVAGCFLNRGSWNGMHLLNRLSTESIQNVTCERAPTQDELQLQDEGDSGKI
jgi:hypothetical protein